MTTEPLRTTTLTEVEIPVDTQFDDAHEHFGELYCHYVHPEDLLTKMVAGLPVTAFCGYTWLPNRFIDNDELPLCPACKEAFVLGGWE